MVNSRIDPHNGIILCTDRPHLLSPLNKPKQAGILNIKGICPATQLSVSGLCSLLTYHTVVALTWTFQIQTTEFVLNSLSTVSIGCFCFNFRLFYFGLQSIAGIYVNCVVPMQSMRCFYYFPACSAQWVVSVSWSGRAKVPPCAVPGKYLPKIPSGDNCRGVAQWTPGPGRAPGQGSTPQLLILILGHLSFENIPSCLFRIFSLRTLATRHQMGPNVYTETDTHLGTYLARHMGLTLAPAQHAWTCVKK